MSNFMAQTGDPTNTGRGGSSVFDSGRPFKDEFHSRLRFNTRGRVAMANEGRKDSNGSQWFVTLGECEWLNRKHTIFGKVVGATMYNAIQIGNVETENDRPVAPAPKIVKTEVLANPFPDIEPRKPTNVEEEEVVEDFRKKKKAKKKLNLLSFGEEAAEEEATLDEVGIKGIKSSHDVGGDATLVSADAEETRAALEQTAREKAMAKEKKARVKERMQDMGADVSDDDADEGKDRGKSGWDDAAGADDAAAFQDQMRDKMLRKRRELGDVDGGLKEIEEDIRKQSDALASKLDKREMKAKRKAEKEAREAERVHRRATKLKKLGLGKCAVRDADAALMTSDEVKRVEAKARRSRVHDREKDTLARLAAFSSKQPAAPKSDPKSDRDDDKNDDEEEIGRVGVSRFVPQGLYYMEDDEDEDDASDWKAHKLAFVPESKRNDQGAYVADVDDYVVFDPLLEKGKGKFADKGGKPSTKR